MEEGDGLGSRGWIAEWTVKELVSMTVVTRRHSEALLRRRLSSCSNGFGLFHGLLPKQARYQTALYPGALSIAAGRLLKPNDRPSLDQIATHP